MWQYVRNRFKRKPKVSTIAPTHPKVSAAAPTHPKPAHAKSIAPSVKKEAAHVSNQIKHIIAIASGKGGVGKSTVCSNLAFALTAQGHKVGVLDADIYGPSQASLLGNIGKAQGENGALLPMESHGVKFISMSSVNPKDGAIIVRAPVATRAVNQFLTDVKWGELDYLLVDLPPGTGDIPLSLAQKASLSGVVIVTTPQPMATDIAVKSLQMFKKVNVPILGVIENMSAYICPHCHETSTIFNVGGGQRIAQENDIALLAQIPLDPALLSSSEQGKSLVIDAPNSAPSLAFLQAAKQLHFQQVHV